MAEDLSGRQVTGQQRPGGGPDRIVGRQELVVVQPHRTAVADSDEEHERGQDLGEVGEVVRPAGVQRPADAKPEGGQVAAGHLGEPRVVAQRRLTGQERYLSGAPVGHRDPGGDLREPLLEQRALGRRHGAQGASRGGDLGRRVGGVPGVQGADGDDGGDHRVGRSADDLLRADRELSQREDGVGGQVRIRSMAAAAPHRHLELVRRRVHHAAVARHQPVGQHRLHVRADHRPHVVLRQDARCGHIQRA